MFNFHNYILTIIIIQLFTLCVYAKDGFPYYPPVPPRPTLQELKVSLGKVLNQDDKNVKLDSTSNKPVKLRGLRIFHRKNQTHEN